MADTVLHDLTDHLATITLNRPDAMNALDTATKEALRDALLDAAADPGVRAVLLTGVGRAFCVGQDLREHAGSLAARGTGDGDRGAALDTVAEHYNPITRAILEMPKPVVAGINGTAAGAGMGFALAADYRVAAAGARFTTAFAGVGLAADSGLSWTLPRLVGPARAADLLYFPRTLDAAAAERLGLVQRVVPDEELPAVALEIARDLAKGPTVAYAGIKEAMAFGATHSAAETLELEGRLQSRAGATEDHREAVNAFVAKRTPRFTGR
ncbi:enoyl-CoA hydratase-related protein [Streptomyces sp. ST2-7A]|uniref:enoyl-CoA hydratase-related protein n=1 Tax=Streptomyces sp. ST2-7A TaxID=2907214 RepID=UPI001F2A5CA9|nr:enoyl-CoA hydratase-related protein [Streptomyces sp. ST2-7A]MCE7083438.1 enoyl-CoA hydratase-related protein [Streptomyces sp. ST2-7A]